MPFYRGSRSLWRPGLQRQTLMPQLASIRRRPKNLSQWGVRLARLGSRAPHLMRCLIRPCYLPESTDVFSFYAFLIFIVEGFLSTGSLDSALLDHFLIFLSPSHPLTSSPFSPNVGCRTSRVLMWNRPQKLSSLNRVRNITPWPKLFAFFFFLILSSKWGLRSRDARPSSGPSLARTTASVGVHPDEPAVSYSPCRACRLV